MTRKRFVKKLMAMGYSRNKANDFAKTVRVSYSSYKIAYELLNMELLTGTIDSTLKDLFPAFSVIAPPYADFLAWRFI